MLTRLLVLAVLGGLGVGLVLRIWFGRGRFRAVVSFATLPVLVHTALSLAAGLRAGVPTATLAAHLALGLAICVAGVILGRRNVDARPWLAVFTPLLSAVVYSATALVLIGLALRATGQGLDVLAVAGMVTGSIFATCALVSFAPPAFALSARRRG